MQLKFRKHYFNSKSFCHTSPTSFLIAFGINTYSRYEKTETLHCPFLKVSSTENTTIKETSIGTIQCLLSNLLIKTKYEFETNQFELSFVYMFHLNQEVRQISSKSKKIDLVQK